MEVTFSCFLPDTSHDMFLLSYRITGRKALGVSVDKNTHQNLYETRYSFQLILLYTESKVIK